MFLRSKKKLTGVSSKLHRKITIEPASFFFFLAHHISGFLNTNLYLHKECRPNATVQPDLDTVDTWCTDDKSGITFIATTFSIQATVTGVICMMSCIFASAYSDLAGKKRKIFILIAITGKLVQSVNGALQSWFWQWPSELGVYCHSIVGSLSGGLIYVVIFANINICDDTSSEERFTKLFVVSCIRLIATFFGRGSAGYLLQTIGFFGSYVLCLVLQAASLFTAVVCIRDVKDDDRQESESGMKNGILGTSETHSQMDILMHVFNINELLVSYKSLFFSEKRRLKHRIAVIILFVIGTGVQFANTGEESVDYLYFRNRFHWNEKTFSFFNAYRLLTGIIGGYIGTTVMIKKLKIHDCLIGSFASLFDGMAGAGYFMANESWQVQLVPLLDIFNGVSLTIYSSYITKFFIREEFGRLYSMRMLFSCIVPFSTTIYSYVFKSLIDTLPSGFYLISIVFYGISLVGYSIIYKLSKDVS